ncbi:uncharacterized protein LOC113564680 [Drosophila erecta]|uniref:uncharacterized protein LOC113564680 n=1 Tax=Drosophila erecta TaxID=7220 RepID=UPI000F071F73|nr:uncharacterized protein LOC113564680 [Drosophila erecta]
MVIEAVEETEQKIQVLPDIRRLQPIETVKFFLLLEGVILGRRLSEDSKVLDGKDKWRAKEQLIKEKSLSSQLTGSQAGALRRKTASSKQHTRNFKMGGTESKASHNAAVEVIDYKDEILTVAVLQVLLQTSKGLGAVSAAA